MSRYTDADALKQQVESPYTEYPIMIQIRKTLKDFIDDAPSIDIVRCKECRYWTNNEMQFDNNLVVAPCKQWLQYTRMNGYCHNGERKESE